MLWEELTSIKFEEAVKNCGGVCILPIGVLEKHGQHLPLGTDMMAVNAVCKAAAEQESAIVFPYYFFGQISEARQCPGTISVSSRMQMESLLAMCDEIARNGLKKIIIMSGHGGNHHFLPYFAQEMPRLDRDYSVYTGYASDLSNEQINIIAETAGTRDFGYHAGLTETALMLHVRSDLVDMDAQTPEEGQRLGRLSAIEESRLYTGFNWYANYPHHFAGDHTKSTKELGAMIFDMKVENIVKAIRAVKADNVSGELTREFAERSRNH